MPKSKKLEYPDNIIQAIFGEVIELNADQMDALNEIVNYGWIYRVLYFKYKLGWRNKEIAEKMDLTPANISYRIKRALNNIDKEYILGGKKKAETEKDCKEATSIIERIWHSYSRLLEISKSNPEAYSLAVAIQKMKHPEQTAIIEPEFNYIAKKDGSIIHFFEQEEAK